MSIDDYYPWGLAQMAWRHGRGEIRSANLSSALAGTEPDMSSKCNFAFMDGHAESIKAEQFQERTPARLTASEAAFEVPFLVKGLR